MTRIFLILTMLSLISCIKTQDSEISEGANAVSKKSYSRCVDYGAESQTEKYTFYSTGNFMIETEYYSANNCASVAKSKDTIYGYYNYNQLTNELTEQVYRLKVKFLTEAEVAARNAEPYCNFTDWAINVPKDITDNDDCMGGTVASNGTPFTYNNVTMNEIKLDYGDGTILLRSND